MKRRLWVLSLLLTLVFILSCEPQGSREISGPSEEISGEAQLGSPFPGGEAQVEDGDLSTEPPASESDGGMPNIQTRITDIQTRETPELIASDVNKHFDFELHPAFNPAKPVVVYQQFAYLNYARFEEDHWEKEYVTSPKIISDPSGKIIPPALFPNMAIRGGEMRVAYVKDRKVYLTSRVGSGWSPSTNEGLPALTNDNYFHLAHGGWVYDIFYLAYRNTGGELFYGPVASASPSRLGSSGTGRGPLFLTPGPRRGLYLFESTPAALKLKKLLPSEGGWTYLEGISPQGAVALAATDSDFHAAYESTGRLLRYLRFDEEGRINSASVAIIGNGSNPSIGVQGENIFITYYQDQALWLTKKLTSDGGWQQPRKIDGGAGENAGEKSIVKADSEGKVHVVYYDTLNRSLRYYSHD